MVLGSGLLSSAVSWHNFGPQHWPAQSQLWGEHGPTGNPSEVHVQVGRGRWGVSSTLWVVPFGLRDGEWAQLALFSHMGPAFRPGLVGLRVSPSLSLFHADGNVRGMTLESPGSSLSQVTLVSTLYFRSMWQKKFSFMDTQMLPFTTPVGSTLKVPTMHHTAEVNYGNCPWSIFDLLYNMEQVYLISTDTTLRCVIFPAWRSRRRSPIKWRHHPGDQIDSS